MQHKYIVMLNNFDKICLNALSKLVAVVQHLGGVI